jgi:translation initiation factor 4A
MLTSADQIESNYDETVDSFDTMNLKAELLRGALCDEIAVGADRSRHLRLRLRAPICHPAARHHARHQE